MITPYKYLNLDLSVVNIAAFILGELKKNEILKHDELISLVVNSFGENAKEIIPYSLNFLFLLDKIIYHDGELDAFQVKEVLNEAE